MAKVNTRTGIPVRVETMALFRRRRKGDVLAVKAIGMRWDTEDPFTYASHHEDDYPHGNAQQAPPLQEIAGRNLGRDYEQRLGFRMYHGKVVPGFPAHAHQGYETVTVPVLGCIDHFDNLGNQGRYCGGDVHWLTAGKRYQHCEMYPLVHNDRRNPNDITQIMINLPLGRKDAEPVQNMVWAEDVPHVRGDGWDVTVIAGAFGDAAARVPNPDSWAADAANHVRILRIAMEPGAGITLPAVPEGVNRNLYSVSGGGLRVDGGTYRSETRFKLAADADIEVVNGDAAAALWLLEGRPIGERQVSFGPVILGDDREVREALDEIRRRHLDDWPWDYVDQTHPRDTLRFIRYADGREERPASRP
ncbi:MAG: pirin family protein [Euryarchaeota archaeon]|nr:pirin family protein [Euryarchaeota archaeon]